jgi:hypothetical protein
MDEENEAGNPAGEVSLEDELRNQFGPSVLLDNDEHQSNPEYPDDAESAYGYGAEDLDGADQYEEPMDYGPVDLRSRNGAHQVSDSDSEDPDANPLRELIQRNSVILTFGFLSVVRFPLVTFSP